MENSEKALREMLSRFWDWAGYDAVRFAAGELIDDDEEEPFFFPEFSQMQGLCCDCEHGDVSDAVIHDYLTCMALDNDMEWILDHCVAHAPDAFVERIVMAALTHPQPYARGQIADLLRRREIPEREAILHVLSRDPNPYVRRRAKVSLDDLKMDV